MQRPTFTAWLGLGIIALAAFVFAFAPWIAPHGLEETVGVPFAAASPEFALGLDQNGRDMLSRLLYGAQMSIGVSLAAVLLSFSIGIPLGFFAAIRGGWTDVILSRGVDTLMSVPVLLSALVVLQALGWSIPVLIVVGSAPSLVRTRADFPPDPRMKTAARPAGMPAWGATTEAGETRRPGPPWSPR